MSAPPPEDKRSVGTERGQACEEEALACCPRTHPGQGPSRQPAGERGSSAALQPPRRPAGRGGKGPWKGLAQPGRQRTSQPTKDERLSGFHFH